MIIYQEDLENLEPLKRHQYSSEDHSILSRLVLRRYWNWVMKFVPMTVAPNTITLIGGISMAVSTVLTLMLDPSLSSPRTRFLHLINALCLFFYSTMDSIDGKQAARTLSASPLGQLMDHGIDSLVAALLVITLSSSIGLGTGRDFVLLLLLIYMVFYCMTLYEKFTSKMVFGYINGPSEGVMFCVAVHMVAFLFGPSTFSAIHRNDIAAVFGLDASNLFVLMVLFGVLYTVYFVVDFCINVGTKHLPTVVKHVLVAHGMFLPSMMISSIEAFKKQAVFYPATLVIMLLFSYMTIEVILSRLKDTDIPNPPDGYFLFLFSSVLYIFNWDHAIVESYILCLSVFVAVSYVVRVLSISHAISRFLGIRIFHIKLKEQ